MGSVRFLRKALTHVKKIQYEDKCYLAAIVIFTIVGSIQLVPGKPQASFTAATLCLMSILWLTRALPIGVTSLLPLVIFPLFGVLPGKKVATLYFNDIQWVFAGSFFLAIAVEKTGLHERLALHVIRLIGSSPRRLLLGLGVGTAVLSACMSNTGTTVMMVPIAKAIVNGIEQSTQLDWSGLRSAAMLAVSYSANIGGTSTLTGTGPNLILAGQLPSLFPNAPVNEVSYFKWFIFAMPLAILLFLVSQGVLMVCVKFWQPSVEQRISFPFNHSPPRSDEFEQEMDENADHGNSESDVQRLLPSNTSSCEASGVQDSQLFSGENDNSTDEQTFSAFAHTNNSSSGPDAMNSHMDGQSEGSDKIGRRIPTSDQEVANVVAAVVRERLVHMGKASRKENIVLALLVTLTLLWLTRDFGVVPGWSALLPTGAYITDGCPAIFVATMLFVFRDEGKPVLTWDACREFPWDLSLLLGSGYVMATGVQESGLSEWLGHRVSGLNSMGTTGVLIVLCVGVSLLTELVSNIATVNILLPVVAQLAVTSDVHPLTYMLPTTIACSLAFILPISTPPNAIAYGSGGVPIHRMVQAGIFTNIICVTLLVIASATYGRAVFGLLSSLPDWAKL